MMWRVGFQLNGTPSRAVYKTVAELNDLQQEIEAFASRVDSAGQKSKEKSEYRCFPRVHRPLCVTPFLRNNTSTTIGGRSQRARLCHEAVQPVQSRHHFDVVHDVATFTSDMDWRTTSQDSLPSWLGISKLITNSDALYYYSTIVIYIEKADAQESAQAVIYTPYGVQADSFTAMMSSRPLVETLAFSHGLHDVSIALSKQLNPGAHNALKAQRMLNAKYWVGIHDEAKIGGGLIAPFLRRKHT